MSKTDKTDTIKLSAHVGRLDRFLTGQFPHLSRTFFQRLIKNKHVLVDGKPISANSQGKPRQILVIKWPTQEKTTKKKPKGKIPVPIIFEDNDFFVLNKWPNLLVHPAGHPKGETLVEMMSPWTEKFEGWPDDVRPGLVHRLDKDTSGVILFAKNPLTHAQISKQFADRKVKKTYLALVKGEMPSKEGKLECLIARHPGRRQQYMVAGHGREAVSHYKVQKTFPKKATLVEVKPLTGRTHQIRVQLAGVGYPVLGDSVYGGNQQGYEFVPRQMLHAFQIQFLHPKTRKTVKFEAPLPDDFQTVLKELRSKHD